MLATPNKRDSNLILSLARVDRASAAYRVLVPVVLLVTVTLVFAYYLSMFEWEPNPWHGLSGMISGTAWKPYVTRVLIPWLIRPIVAVLSVRPEWVAAGLMFLSLAGFVFAFRYLLTAFWPACILSDMLTWLALIGLLPIMASFSRHIYDFATLFFFTLELGLLAHRQWKWFLIVFPLACVNRETSFLLSLVFAVHFYPRIERQLLVKLLAVQALVFVAIRLYILWLFKDNAGGALDIHLGVQLYVLSQIASFSAIGLLALLFVICGFAILLMMLYRWKEKPQFLRDSAVAIVPLLVLSYLLFGMPFEIRAFYEAFPVVFILCVEPMFSRLSLEAEAAVAVVG